MAVKKNQTDDRRLEIYHALLEMSENGQLKHGSVKDVTKKFDIFRHTVMRVWKREKSSMAKGSVTEDVCSRAKGNRGNKCRDTNL